MGFLVLLYNMNKKRKGLTPQGYYTAKNGAQYHYQSSYERKLMIYLDERNIVFEKCKDRFPYTDVEGKKRTYNPDLYLPDFDIYIETKGMIRMNDPAKFEAFPKNKILVLITADEMKDLGIKVFDPGNIDPEKVDKTKWPYTLLSHLPDFQIRGELTETIKEYFKVNYVKFKNIIKENV